MLTQSDETASIRLDTRPESVAIDLRRTALIVVDMQNAYLSKGGYIDLCGFDVSTAPTVIDRVGRLVDAARRAGLAVIWLQNGFSSEFRERGLDRSPLFHKSNALKFMRANPEYDGKLIVEGTWDYAFVDSLEPAISEPVVRKARYSGFCGTHLDGMLRARGIETVVVVGVNTNVCVESTIRDAYHQEYFAIMVADATMPSGSSDIFSATVFNVERFFGWTISTDSMVRALDGAAA